MAAPLRLLVPNRCASGASAEPAGPARVLLLASDPAVVQAVRDGVREPGTARIRLQHAERLEDRLSLLLGGAMDVVLLDLDLPDGPGLLTLLRLHTYTPRLPVVVLCRPDDEGTARWALEAGAVDYLVKGQADGPALAWTVGYAVDRAAWLAREEAARGRAEAALADRDAVLAAVSHDLRNPLAVIKLLAELAREQVVALPGRDATDLGAATAAVTDLLGRIDALTGRMDGHIQELLDVARLRDGHLLTLERAPANLVELGQIAADEHTRVGHLVRLEVPAGQLLADIDRARVLRVLDNLLSNAVKYSPPGSEIVVRLARAVARGATWAEIEVTDRGIGIPAADLSQVFEPFHRASNTQGQVAGTGLGLWGVQRIVAQHGGTLTLESQEGVGTTVIVRLPLIRRRGARPVPPPAETGPGRARQQPRPSARRAGLPLR